MTKRKFKIGDEVLVWGMIITDTGVVMFERRNGYPSALNAAEHYLGKLDWKEDSHRIHYRIDVSALKGKTVTGISVWNGNVVAFNTDEGVYVMYHTPECCESVDLEDVNGDFEDLIGVPMLEVRKSTNDDSPMNTYDEAHLWTFYTFRTIKGSVDLRWYGTSNGYYSIEVDGAFFDADDSEI